MMYWIKYSAKSVLRRYKKTIVIFTGFTFSITCLVFLAAVMTGVNDTMIQNALNLHSGYITIQGRPADYKTASQKLSSIDNELTNISEISTALKRLTIPLMIQTETDTAAVLLNGINEKEESHITPVSEKITDGNYRINEGLLIGRKTAEILNIKAGDQVKCYTPLSLIEIKVTGIFETGIYNFDSGMAFTNIEIFKTLNDKLINYHLALFLDNNDNLKEVALKTASALPEEKVSLWEDNLPEISQLVKLNETAMKIMILLVILILGFSITNTLMTSVLDRKKYFSIMKAMGIRSGEIIITIVSESVIICLSSGIAGTLLGILIVAITAWTGGIDMSAYTSHNPNFAVNSMIIPRLTADMTLFPQLLAIVSGVLSSFIPALKITKQKVVSGMRDL